MIRFQRPQLTGGPPLLSWVVSPKRLQNGVRTHSTHGALGCRLPIVP